MAEYRMPNDCYICEYGGWDHVCPGCGTYLGHEMGECGDPTCGRYDTAS